MAGEIPVETQATATSQGIGWQTKLKLFGSESLTLILFWWTGKRTLVMCCISLLPAKRRMLEISYLLT
jgi:hypothetical protein